MNAHTSVQELYDSYQLPEHLQMHMLWVSAVAKYITDQWNGPAIDRDTLINILLIHDIGNLVKIGLDEQDAAQGHTKEMFAMRAALIEKFGNNDHAVSNGIAVELGLTPYALEILENKIFMKNDQTVKGSDYTLKLAAYADERVTFGGVVTLERRMSDGLERYKNKPGSSFNNPKTQKMIACAYEIEQQIAEHFQGDLNAIITDDLSQEIQMLRTSLFPYQP